MKQVLLMIAVVALVGCGKEEQGPSQPEPATLPQTTEKPKPPKAEPTKLITDPIVDKAVRKSLKKPEGELSKSDLAIVTKLALSNTQITDADLEEVAKLQNLTFIDLDDTKVTRAGAAELLKALPMCRILR